MERNISQDKRKEFGKYIQSLRESKGFSKRHVSSELGYKGLGTIHAVEQGITSLPLERIFDLAKLYGIDIEDILEKLSKCEPQLYRRFCDLEDRYWWHFSKKFRGQSRHGHKFQASAMSNLEIGEKAQTEKKASLHMQNYQDIGGHNQAKHHRPFSNSINTLLNTDVGLHPAPEYILSDILNLLIFISPSDIATLYRLIKKTFFVDLSTKNAQLSRFSVFSSKSKSVRNNSGQLVSFVQKVRSLEHFCTSPIPPRKEVFTIDTQEIHDYIIKEIIQMQSPKYWPLLLDIFYLIIQQDGKSYQYFRKAWIAARERQFELFESN